APGGSRSSPPRRWPPLRRTSTRASTYVTSLVCARRGSPSLRRGRRRGLFRRPGLTREADLDLRASLAAGLEEFCRREGEVARDERIGVGVDSRVVIEHVAVIELARERDLLFDVAEIGAEAHEVL